MRKIKASMVLQLFLGVTLLAVGLLKIGIEYQAGMVATAVGGGSLCSAVVSYFWD